MEPINPVGLEPDILAQQRAAVEEAQRRAAHLREAEQLFQTSQTELTRQAEAADQDAKAGQAREIDQVSWTEEAAEAEQTRLAKLVRDAEQTRLGELAYQAEQVRVAEEAADLPPGSPVSVFL